MKTGTLMFRFHTQQNGGIGKRNISVKPHKMLLQVSGCPLKVFFFCYVYNDTFDTLVRNGLSVSHAEFSSVCSLSIKVCLAQF